MNDETSRELRITEWALRGHPMRVQKVAICAGCGRTATEWRETEIGGDIWEPYCKDCPCPAGDGEWEYRGHTITQRWKLPRPGYRAQPDTFAWVHPDYDGAPMETGGPPADKRCGYAQTLAEACDQIDESIEREEKA